MPSGPAYHRAYKASLSYLIAKKVNVEKFEFKEEWRGGNRDKGRTRDKESGRDCRGAEGRGTVSHRGREKKGDRHRQRNRGREGGRRKCKRTLETNKE